MRPANLSIKTAIAAAIALSSSAYALTSLPPEAPIPAVTPATTAVSSAAVTSIPMGKPVVASDKTRKVAGTIEELEDLQRLTVLADARKRLKELQTTKVDDSLVSPIAAVPVTGNGAVKAHIKRAVLKESNRQSNYAPPVAPIIYVDPIANTPPSAKLLSMLVVGGRSRADVLDGTRVTTIKEGEKLGGWTVTRISGDGVELEYRYTVYNQNNAVPVPEAGKRSSIAEAMPAAFALVNANTAPSSVDKVKTFKLLPATALEVAAANSSVASPAPSAVATSLPKVPDSTSVVTVPPLPPALGAM